MPEPAIGPLSDSVAAVIIAARIWHRQHLADHPDDTDWTAEEMMLHGAVGMMLATDPDAGLPVAKDPSDG